MSVHDQILVGIMLWIMAPVLMVVILIAPLAVTAALDRGLRALRHHAEALRHTFCRARQALNGR